MSETQFPSSTPTPPGQSPRADRGGEQTARLIHIPENLRAELQTRRAALRVQGEVVGENRDGSIRVRTPRGDVDVRVRDNAPRPEAGQKVEIEIRPDRSAPERPQETAQLREITRPAQNSETPPQPQQQQRTSSTPVDVQVRENATASPQAPQVRPEQTAQPLPPQPSAQNALPPEGTIVRLQPLPTRTAEALPLPQFTQDIITTLPARVSFQAGLIAQSITNQIQGELLQTPPATITPAPIQSVLQPEPLQQTLTQTQPQATPALLQLNLQTPIATPNAPAAAPTPQPTILNTQNIKPTPGILPPVLNAPSQQLLQTPVNPQAQTETLPSTIPLKPLPLDVRIERITPPQIQLVPPTQTQTKNTPQTLPIENTPENPAPLILQNQKAASLTGIVTNVTPDKLPVLTAFFPQLGAEQIFTLQFPTDSITIGTQIQVTPQITATASTTTTATATLPELLPLPVYLQPQPWPALDEALQTLARTAPQAAQAFVNVTPSPANPAQLGPAILFFIAAVRGGDLTQWLGGKATDALKTAKAGSVLGRLLGEGQALTRIASEQMPQDWRALNIPLYWQGDMHKIALYYKHEREEQDDQDSGLKSTRFIFDLALHHMGKVQLDGLFRPGRLDVALRTEEPFSQNSQAEMRRIYARALRDTEITGELSFQNQPESWVTIHADHKNQLGVSA